MKSLVSSIVLALALAHLCHGFAPALRHHAKDSQSEAFTKCCKDAGIHTPGGLKMCVYPPDTNGEGNGTDQGP